MKSIYLIFVLYLGSSNAQFPFFGGITNAVSSGVENLRKGVVGGITGVASEKLQDLTKNTFGDKKDAKDGPAKFAYSVADGLTAGLDGLNNKGVAEGLTSFVKETGKGLTKGITGGAYETFKETMKEITEAFIEELKTMAPEVFQQYKGAFYTAIGIAGIQAAAKLYRSVSLAKQPPLKRAYEKIINNL